MSVLIEQSDSVAIIEEPQATSTRGGSTLTRATPFEVTSTACTTTTVTSADLASANLYAYVGNWLQVLDGNCAGEWVQIRDRAGKPEDKVVALPVKDPYHITRAFMHAIQCLGRLESRHQ